MKVLFIHRSVGHHLIKQGKLRQLLANKDIAFDDYDNNLGILTKNDGNTQKNALKIPGNNTNPDNLAQLFEGWPQILNNYDLIIIKSCYPNSHIRDKHHLDIIKESYKSIIHSFEINNKKLMILTTPPLRPFATNKKESNLANELAEWLVSQAVNGVQVFDYHHMLSEINGTHSGMLKRQFRRILPVDNHPNKRAHKLIAPILANAISTKV